MSKKKQKLIEFKVVLNGTYENPYHKLGLEMNPFPQIGDSRFDETPIKILAATPILNAAHIRKVLKGFDKEFVTECCKRFKKGERVEFAVSFPDTRD